MATTKGKDMDGNSATADPTSQNASPSDTGVSGSSEGAGSVDLAQEVTKLKEQYSNSSREAHKLVDELKQEREARIRLESSLKAKEQQSTQKGFPEEELYVKHWTDLGQDERIARAEYREKRIYYDNQQFLSQQLQATQNLLKFQREDQERAIYQLNPDVQKAKDFFKGIPELESLPPAELVQRMKDLNSRMGIKSEGRDTTQIKLAASGGSTSGGGRSMDTSMTAEDDSRAKANGFDNAKQQSEMAACRTAQDYAEWKKRWKK